MIKALPVLSASSTQEWINCALRAWLPEERSSAGPAAMVGTRFHELIDAAVTARQWVPLEPLDEVFETPLNNALEWLSRTVTSSVMLSEQAYELHPTGAGGPMTCRRLESSGHRAYPNIKGHIYGTADVVAIDGTMAHVIDWKTGKKSDAHASQLKTLALMVSEAEQVTLVNVSAVYVNLQSGKVTVHSTVLDAFDLHVHAGAINQLSLRLLDDEPPDPNPGKYCFFCPSLGCPEKVRARR